MLQGSIIDEQIEDNLFRMLDEETDTEYVRSLPSYVDHQLVI